MGQDRGWAPRKITRQIGGEKQTMKKRILALALALCMVFSMTVTASAAEGDTAIPEAVPAVDVTATEEAAETDGITVSNGITVTDEGNYHVSRAADDGNRYIWVPDGAVIGGGV